MSNKSEQNSEFGDFEEVKEEPKPGEQLQDQTDQTIARVRNPRGKELIGVIVQRLGGNRMETLATDGKTRNCRVPGRYRRKLWLRPKDIVLIVPWEFDDGKADIIYKYQKGAIIQLRKKGILDSLTSGF